MGANGSSPWLCNFISMSLRKVSTYVRKLLLTFTNLPLQLCCTCHTKVRHLCRVVADHWSVFSALGSKDFLSGDTNIYSLVCVFTNLDTFAHLNAVRYVSCT